MENTSYAEIMRDSLVRKEAIRKLIVEIQEKTKRVFTEKDIRFFTEVLENYEVEDGVSVFMTPRKPSDKYKIARIRCRNEYAILWWGPNKNAHKISNPNRFALGITYEDIPYNEHTYFTTDELVKKFPEFTEVFAMLKPSDEIKLFAYAQAGTFSRAVMEREGIWLLQTPEGKSFVPSKPIGKRIGNEIHLFWSGNNIKKDYFKKLIQIIE